MRGRDLGRGLRPLPSKKNILIRRNRNFFTSGSVHRLGLGLVVAVRWWGAGEGSGEGALPSKKNILIYSVPAAGSRTAIIYCRDIASG